MSIVINKEAVTICGSLFVYNITNNVKEIRKKKGYLLKIIKIHIIVFITKYVTFMYVFVETVTKS